MYSVFIWNCSAVVAVRRTWKRGSAPISSIQILPINSHKLFFISFVTFFMIIILTVFLYQHSLYLIRGRSYTTGTHTYWMCAQCIHGKLWFSLTRDEIERRKRECKSDRDIKWTHFNTHHSYFPCEIAQNNHNNSFCRGGYYAVMHRLWNWNCLKYEERENSL